MADWSGLQVVDGVITLSFYGLAIALLRDARRSNQSSLRPLLLLLGLLFLACGTAYGLRVKAPEWPAWSLTLAEFLTALIAFYTAFILTRRPLALAIFPEGNAQEQWEKDIALSREVNENVQRLNTELEQRVAERTAALEAANQQKQQALLDLQAREREFRAIFEQAAVGMARLTLEGHWVQVNQKLCDLLGYTQEELRQRTFQELTYPDDYELDQAYYQKLLTGELETCSFEKRYLHKSGEPIWTLATASKEYTDEGTIACFIAVIEDIRVRKLTEQQLQQRAKELTDLNVILAQTATLLEKRNSELDQFAYAASHDLKAPLRAIANLSEWIEEDLTSQFELPEENLHQLALLRGRVHRMEALINGLLQYSRVGRQKASIVPVKVQQLISEIVDSLDLPSGFQVELLTEMPVLNTNQAAIQQVFSNLINNAVKHHNRKEGHVWVSCGDRGTFYEFSVADDGPGIAPQYHEKVFTIFQTLKSRDEMESTGIGLAVVKKIIEAEGGKITLESDFGKGATFRFTWPKDSG
ncbi:PAS domain S-box protein [Leptolyngbya sp. PL-A3]|nr:PAS domain S-box protein [Leptolyngbya sp. FACHB-16]